MKALFLATSMLAVAGAAGAVDLLTDEQLDQVSAGLSVPTAPSTPTFGLSVTAPSAPSEPLEAPENDASTLPSFSFFGFGSL